MDDAARRREDFDLRLREAALDFLRARELRSNGTVRFKDVSEFVFEGTRLPLMDRQRGIRKPRQLEAALSFRTVHASNPDRRPYDDAPGPDGLQRYKWRGRDQHHPENLALRRAMERRLPLIWFQGVEPGVYLPVHPVWLIAEEPRLHQFVVALDGIQLSAAHSLEPAEITRAYAVRLAKERLHQPLFRARVIAAYAGRCALCALRYAELLN
jgi:putative restriction endonuclease